MSESKVRLFPPIEIPPRRSRFPIQRARRWLPPFEDEVEPQVSVFVTPKAFVRFCAHAGTDLECEVGGGLVGKWRLDVRCGRQFVVVENVLPARFTRRGSVFLTFTQDTLVAMNEELEERYPGKQLVGWYHTHPRMGLFLSHYDVWLHKNFFPEPWQIALVIEPHTSIGGFFVCQKDGFLDPNRYFGFYELVDDAQKSVMFWTNLQHGTVLPEREALADIGEGKDE